MAWRCLHCSKFLQTKAQCVLTSAERMGWSRLRHMSIKELCAEFVARITKPPNVQVQIFTTRNLACVRAVLLTCLTMLFLLVVRRMSGYHLSALKGRNHSGRLLMKAELLSAPSKGCLDTWRKLLGNSWAEDGPISDKNLRGVSTVWAAA